MNSRWKLTAYSQFTISVQRETPKGMQSAFAYNVPVMWDYYDLDDLDRAAAASVVSVENAQENSRIQAGDATKIADEVCSKLLDY